MPVSGADRSRASRAWKRRTGASKSLFDTGVFIAIDGEGFSEGPEKISKIGENEYRWRDHFYAYLAASDGSEVYRPVGRLSTRQCLDFLIQRRLEEPRAILCCFGASYDMTHMLADLDRGQVTTLLKGDGTPADRRYLDVTLSDDLDARASLPRQGKTDAHDYRIEWRPRKQLSVWRWPAGAAKYERTLNGKGWKLTDCDRATLWDVWGFFQGTFAGAMDDWLKGDVDYEFILEWKGKRSEFLRTEISDIRVYNSVELRCLRSIMDKLRETLRSLDIRITRWDGAGAVASALLRKHEVKRHMAALPAPVSDAAAHAYSGGHIEAMVIGRHFGVVHHDDLNSAYPAQFRNLPSLAAGRWHREKPGSPRDVAPGYCLVRVMWRFTPGLPFYPLFYRETGGRIVYPERGHGWYWFSEFDAAREFASRFGALEFRAEEVWRFEPGSSEKPFGWVNDYYRERQKIILAMRARGEIDGRHIVIRLGLNALYGKTAQQVGARPDGAGGWIMPAFFQLDWAGFVTAGCRAEIMRAMMQKPHAIVASATDGVFSTEKLDLPRGDGTNKILGEWDYQRHDGMVIVMPGVYWTGPEPGSDKPGRHFSRGFEKSYMREADFVLDAWKAGAMSTHVPARRMVTLGSALASGTMWEMRGCWAESRRRLQLDGMGAKREAVAMTAVAPQKGLVPTHPRDLDEDYALALDHLMSERYPVCSLTVDDCHEDQTAGVLT